MAKPGHWVLLNFWERFLRIPTCFKHSHTFHLELDGGQTPKFWKGLNIQQIVATCCKYQPMLKKTVVRLDCVVTRCAFRRNQVGKKHEPLPVQAKTLQMSGLNFAQRPGNTVCCDMWRPFYSKLRKSWICPLNVDTEQKIDS